MIGRKMERSVYTCLSLLAAFNGCSSFRPHTIGVWGGEGVGSRWSREVVVLYSGRTSVVLIID